MQVRWNAVAMDQAVGRRERKKDQTRRAIAAAALELAVERGPAEVTVDDIAEAADVSTRTVFNYFPSKDAAILGFDSGRAFDAVRRLNERPAAETPVEALCEAFRGLFTAETAKAWRARARLARDHPQLQASYVARFSEYADELTEAVGRRTGLDPASSMYPQLVVALSGAALRVAVDHAFDHPQDLDQTIDEAFRCLAAGLAPPPPGRAATAPAL